MIGALFGALIGLVIVLFIMVFRLRSQVHYLRVAQAATVSKLQEHDAGFFRILTWEPDEGGIIRARKES